jgi:hypothetical protein
LLEDASEEIAMRTCFAVLVALSACGNDKAADIDAPPPPPPAPDAMIDAAECPGMLESCSGLCVNLTNDDKHCGSCAMACTPAASCADSACGCPAAFIGATPTVLATQMIMAQTGFVSGVEAVAGTDSNNHGVVVSASATAPLNTALTVNVNNQVFVAIVYEILGANQSRSTYLATTGTVKLTRRCTAGIAGTITNASLVEVDPTTFQPIANGCSTTIAQLAFDIAQPCP